MALQPNSDGFEPTSTVFEPCGGRMGCGPLCTRLLGRLAIMARWENCSSQMALQMAFTRRGGQTSESTQQVWIEMIKAHEGTTSDCCGFPPHQDTFLSDHGRIHESWTGSVYRCWGHFVS